MIRPGALVACALWLTASTALCDEPPAVLAQSLFEKGRALMAQGDYAHACPAFAQSQRLDPGGGTLLNLAVCHRKQGKLATAWAEFNEALSSALREGRKDREMVARRNIKTLQPELPQLRVALPDHPPPKLAIRLDGSLLSRESLDYAMPVDPGSHRLVASAPGYSSFITTVHVGRGETRTVEVPALQAEHPAVAPAPTSSSPAPAPTSSSVAPARAPSSRPLAEPVQRAGAPMPAAHGMRTTKTRLATGSYVSGGVALAAFGAAIATGLIALSADRSARSKCSTKRNYCQDPSWASDASRARTFAWISTGTLGVGLIASVTAIAWPREEVPSAVDAGPEARVTFSGRF